MPIRILVLTFVLTLLSTTGQTDGLLNISFQNRDGFGKTNIIEKDGARQGVWTTGTSKIRLISKQEGDRWNLDIGNMQDYLVVKTSGNRNSYRGFFWGRNKVTTMDTYLEKDLIRVVGTVAETIKFKVYAYPSKGKMDLEWNGILLSLVTTPAKGDGSCKGTIKLGSQELGRITCQSSGTLKDALFNSAPDIIAWLVHIYVVPNED
jgi:hypothetical protein